jgi:superfamily II DNA or RNA helicase
VNQTYKEFVGVGLEIGRISSKTKDKKLEWSKQNVVCTWQTLNRHREHLGNFHVVLYDEAHIMGDVMFEVLSNELAHAPVRVGFTGTVPKDKQKKQKVLCHIGGDVLKKVTAKELQDEGYISTLDIYMVPVRHEVNLDGEWETEFSYLCNNKHRLKAIAEFIEDVHATSPIPTLILCHPQFGVRLADKLQLNYIDGTVDPKVREKYYVEYKNTPNYRLIASYDTVGTGISINEITRVIMVDVGKNDTRILQGLGRGLRLDGDTNHLQAFDLYAEMYWEGEERGYSGGKHLSGRKKIYRENQYPFREVEAINVIDPGH